MTLLVQVLVGVGELRLPGRRELPLHVLVCGPNLRILVSFSEPLGVPVQLPLDIGFLWRHHPGQNQGTAHPE